MRRTVGLLAGALLWFGSAAWVTAASPAPVSAIGTTQAGQAAMDAARERVAAGDLDGALKGLTAYVNAHPGEADPERLLGDLYYRQGNLAKAQASYEHILSYAPLDKETHNRLGSVFASENKIDEAIAEFDRSLPGTDSVPDLVALHLRKGDFQQYKHDREQLVQEYPGNTEDILELAQLYEYISEPKLATQYFQRVLDTQPRDLFALNGMGLTLEDEHAYTDAITVLRTCLLYDPYSYPCWTNLGGAYLDLGQNDDAAKALDVARRLEPERPEAWVDLGNVADDRGDWKRAIKYYVQATTVDPFAPEAYSDLGATYNDQGLYQLAQSALAKGLAVAPENGRLHLVLGDTYRRMGQTANARAQFEQAASQSIDSDTSALAKQFLASLGSVTVVPAKP